MKKVLLTSMVLLLTVSGTVFAAPPRDNCGCGLGSMLFEGKSGFVQQILASTTNGSFGSQTFGISSGTSECKQPTQFASNEELNIFVAENMDNIAKDVAMGKGEYLDTLAGRMDVPESNRVEFSQMLQDNFLKVFPDASVSHADVIENIASLM
jgi:hypothetical protein